MSLPASSSQNLTGEARPATRTFFQRCRELILPILRPRPTVTCYDYLGRAKTHGLEQRYVSPTTGVCRKLVVQAVHPREKNERPVTDHASHASKLAIWLITTSPFNRRTFFTWIGVWFYFAFKLLGYCVWMWLWLCAQLTNLNLSSDWTDDSEVYKTGYYKPYARDFSQQLWAARSKKEHSTRGLAENNKEKNIVTHSLYPRLVMIYDPALDKWSACTDPSVIRTKRFLAISYASADVYNNSAPTADKDKELFTQEVRQAAVQMKFDAYWCDLECIGNTPDEKNLDVYCMADVYRTADSTLIVLGNSSGGEQAAWERWGGRVWTLPEALLSPRLFYKFRDRGDINTVSLHQLANLAYNGRESERVVINGYSGKDPLDRLEHLSLLKSAIWQRGISVASTPSAPPPVRDSGIEKIPEVSGPHAAERVYALMGFFGHRIQPNYAEDELRALARLSMSNDNDRIAERMVSLLPRKHHPSAYWYADDDVYDANLWDILPEVQVAGVTENGALVLDGCRAASIRWKDFPQIEPDKTDSVRRQVVGFLPYLAFPIIIVGIAAMAAFSTTAGITLLVVGIVLLLISPKLFVIGEAGRVVDAQPWFIGVKGVMDRDRAAQHLYGGGNHGHYRRIDYTPSGSEFAVPDRDMFRGGSEEQYEDAKKAEARGEQVYTLVDTFSSAVYYFRAQKAPTVCLFTGREGGLGRFVLCSEKCDYDELHKETVLRMPTAVSLKMEMCGWVALG